MNLKALLYSMIFFSSCNYLIEKKNNETFEIGHINLNTLSYNDVREYVFNPKCVSCHGNAGGISLSNYQSVKRNIDSVLKTIDDGSMPQAPTSPLSEGQKTILREWVKLGMPEGPPKAPEILEPKFSSIKKLIFAPKCINCHSGDNRGAKVPLDTVDDLINSPRELVIPGNPDESGLYLAIFRDDDKRMPPKEVGSRLSEEEIAAVVDWIKKGAKD